MRNVLNYSIKISSEEKYNKRLIFSTLFGVLILIVGLLLVNSRKEEIKIAPELPKELPQKELPQEKPKELPPKELPKEEFKFNNVFMEGYLDGYNYRIASPTRWTFSYDYREGFSLGRYDRLNKIQRFPEK